MAKARIGTLHAVLSLNTAKFSKGIERARKRMKQFAASVGRLSKQIFRLAAVASAAAVFALGALIKRSLSSVDKLGKLSATLNIATEDLQALSFAAGLGGASVEELHKGLQIFTRRLGESRMGMGAAVKTFKDLNLNADHLAEMDLATAFKTVADKISGLETAADQTAAAYQIFGRQGVSLLNVLQGGGDSIERVERLLRGMGLTVDRTLVGKVENANDHLALLGQMLQAVGDVAAGEVSPHMSLLAELIATAGVEGESFGERITSGLEGLVTFAGQLMDIFNLVIGWARTTIGIVQGLATAIVWVVEKIANLGIGALGLLGIEINAPLVGLSGELGSRAAENFTGGWSQMGSAINQRGVGAASAFHGRAMAGGGGGFEGTMERILQQIESNTRASRTGPSTG